MFDATILVTRVGLPSYLEHWKMIVFKSIFEHQTVVSITETSFKMALTLCQEMVNYFCQKVQSFVLFGPYEFVQISLACGPNTYQIIYGETLAV